MYLGKWLNAISTLLHKLSDCFAASNLQKRLSRQRIWYSSITWMRGARLHSTISTQTCLCRLQDQGLSAWTFCPPCALCQESRTLTINNVKDGIWYGPTILTAPHPCSRSTTISSLTKPWSWQCYEQDQWEHPVYRWNVMFTALCAVFGSNVLLVVGGRDL